MLCLKNIDFDLIDFSEAPCHSNPNFALVHFRLFPPAWRHMCPYIPKQSPSSLYAPLLDTDYWSRNCWTIAAMVHCIIYGCNNTSTGSTGSFHALPKDPALRNAWLEKISRVGKKWEEARADTRGSGSDDRVCSDHFLDTDFTVPRELAAQLGYKRHSLKPDAVPSQKMRGPNDKPPSPKRRRTAAVKLKFKRTRFCLLYLPPVLFLFYLWGETSTKYLNITDHICFS